MAITAAELLAYKVCDGHDRKCISCGQPNAPVIIKGENYCLWCAFTKALGVIASPKISTL